MKNFFIFTFLMLFAVEGYSADRAKALAITNQLNTYTVSSQSSSPNKAFAFRSNRDDVDDAEVFEANIDTSTYLSNQTITITRDAKDAVLDAGTSCNADYGTVTVNGTDIVVTTIQLPVRVFCASSTGADRVFWTTFQE